MQEIKYRKQRDFDHLTDVDEVLSILKSQFANRRLYVKYDLDKVPVHILDYNEDKSLSVMVEAPLSYEGELVIYGLSDKYIEVDLDVVEQKEGGIYHCVIKSARRALSSRRDLRFKLAPDEVVATNFRVSKQRIDFSHGTIPTSIKVVLDQFSAKNSRMSDIVKVDVFGPDTSSTILGRVRKTGKAVFVPDVTDAESYKPLTDDFVDLTEVYGKELKRVMMKNVERGYTSVMIVPIIYLTDDEQSIPFAYIQLISKSEHFGIEKVLEIKDHAFKLVDRIREANTLLITVRQQVVDISKGGAKLSITDENLRRSILKSRGFIFDIVFKLQAPITIYGEVKVTYPDEGGSLMVGVDFAGNSSRKGEMKRFYSILKPMEADYKARLIQSLKKK